MTKSIFASYIHGIKDTNGESYTNIFKYFFPELITAFVLYSALHLLDAHWVAHLKSTSAYATLGVTNSIIHFLIKVAEGISVGTIILCGKYNGAGMYQKVGKTLSDTFWITCIMGGIIAGTLYFGAHWIYLLLGVPEKMVHLGVPFLRLRAIGIFFTFVYFAFVGFLRATKNTRTPMHIFMVGAVVFIFFDYVLVFGKLGFPALKLNGSALATVIQYFVMLVLAICAVLFNEENKKYGTHLMFSIMDLNNVKTLLFLSLPVIIDKAILAASYIWLGKLIAPMGKIAIAGFAVIKDLERLAFVPALACAQIITFLVSNDFGAGNFSGIKSNIKKVIFVSSIFVGAILMLFIYKAKYFISFFDKKGTFTDFASSIFPFLAIFLFLDLLQLILSGALRGMGKVKTVMWTRLFVCLGCFFPLSYYASNLPIVDPMMKFTLIYGMFYVGSAIMSFTYIKKFRAFSLENNKQ